tara:strand:- start:106 stop:744 length:639 start_codon:yes stop_codon:yes gene_type:complete
MQNSNQPSNGNYANIADLVREGKALNAQWRKLNCVKVTTQANGFDTRLGRLLKQLKAESPNGRISSSQLFRVGVKDIPKQRRSEALWFVENEEVARDFISKSKKGYTSLSALQKAVNKANKPTTEGEDKSDVGQSSEATTSEAKPTLEVTKGDVISLGSSKASVIQALKLWANQNDTTLEELAEGLLDACDPITDFQATLGNPKLATEALPF